MGLVIDSSGGHEVAKVLAQRLTDCCFCHVANTSRDSLSIVPNNYTTLNVHPACQALRTTHLVNASIMSGKVIFDSDVYYGYGTLA